MVLAIAAKQDLEIDQSDIISAFLKGKIDTLVFLLQVEGFKLGSHKYCCLNKTIYGLCQTARMWYSVLNRALIEFGFTRLDADMACWVKISKEGIIFIVVHVDDTLSIGSRRDMDNTKAQLAKKFKTKTWGLEKSL